MEIRQSDIDYSKFEIVRTEYIASTTSPIVTFSKGGISVNARCTDYFKGIKYVKYLIHKEKRQLVIEPQEEYTRDAFRWTTERDRPTMDGKS